MSHRVSNWLDEIGLGKYGPIFAENEIDWDLLPDLDQEFLRAIGVNVVGHQMRILKAARLLTAGSSRIDSVDRVNVDQSPRESTAENFSTPAERRQLTVMFCDLVGSTDLSGRFDPEDLREIVRSYQRSAEEVIQRFDGHIAQYLGDGLLVYFGYPVAHEDDAQRAVHAGVGIPHSIDRLNSQLQSQYGIELSVRIGIHTGPVVVGEMGGNNRREKLAMGETPNLAARLQDLADPGQVVISAPTRRLLGELFELKSLGYQALKGIKNSPRVFTVAGERSAETRYAAGQAIDVTPMIGRKQELALLVDRWRQAVAGEAQLVVLSGEAGIGKSRIMGSLVESLATEQYTRISYQCSPYHTDSALYPAIQQLSFAAAFVAADSPETKLNKLENLLRQSREDVSIATPLLGLLLGLNEAVDARFGVLDYSPPERREQTLKALIEQLTGAAVIKPVLFVLEDAHWIDPTTLELIDLALEHVRDRRIMLLITARPTFNHSFGGHPLVSRLALNRLGREHIMEIVDRLTQGKNLPTELLDEIAAKTDGVPLFVEELTRTLLESGQLRETEKGFEFDGHLDQLTIPSSLRDSLMARLDRMQSIKEVAQAAACIGREFSFGLLAKVSQLHQTNLTAALDQLVTTGLIFQRGVPPRSTYTFKHALVRDAAYESLLKARRQDIHLGLLDQLEEGKDVAFEVLAYHASHADRQISAVGYWEKAGDQAFDRPAFSEALNHFERAVQCLESLPDDPNNRYRELDLRVKIGHVTMALFGYAHPVTVAANAAARELLDTIGETPHRFPILYGNWAFRYVLGDQISALADARAMCDEAERNDNRVQKLIGYRVLGTTHVVMGEFKIAEPTLEHAFAHFDPNLDTQIAWEYGTDHVDTLQLWWGLSLLCRGQAQLAWDRVSSIEDTARDRGHANAYAYALFVLGLLNQIGKTAECKRLGQLLTEVTHCSGLVYWQGLADCHKGALHFEQKEYAEAERKLAAGLKTYQATSSSLFVPFYLAIHASSLSALGRTGDADCAGNAVRAMVENGSESWPTSEVYRLLADANYWHRGSTERAIKGLRYAIEIAKMQGAKFWELRATTSLARLWGDQNERCKGLELLTPVIEDFPAGGRELTDLAEARKLQQELTC